MKQSLRQVVEIGSDQRPHLRMTLVNFEWTQLKDKTHTDTHIHSFSGTVWTQQILTSICESDGQKLWLKQHGENPLDRVLCHDVLP